MRRALDLEPSVLQTLYQEFSGLIKLRSPGPTLILCLFQSLEDLLEPSLHHSPLVQSPADIMLTAWDQKMITAKDR